MRFILTIFKNKVIEEVLRTLFFPLCVGDLTQGSAPARGVLLHWATHPSPKRSWLLLKSTRLKVRPRLNLPSRQKQWRNSSGLVKNTRSLDTGKGTAETQLCFTQKGLKWLVRGHAACAEFSMCWRIILCPPVSKSNLGGTQRGWTWHRGQVKCWFYSFCHFPFKWKIPNTLCCWQCL